MENGYDSAKNYNYEGANNYNYDNAADNLFKATESSAFLGEDGFSGFDSSQSEPISIGFGALKLLAVDSVIRKSFLFMFIALCITGFAALTTSPMTAIRMLTGGSFWILLVVEVAIVLISNAVLRKNNVLLGGILYTVYSFVTGMTLSIIFLAYTGSSIASTLFITAGMFGAMAIFGLVTKKDLSSFGSICIMGLIGLILSGIVNIFVLRSTMFDFAISCIGVVIFAGLTAYDMQKIKVMSETSTIENENALALMGAFQLYLDFINLFLKLLRILGKRK